MRISWPRIPLSISYFGHSKLAQSLETVRNFCIFKTEIILRHLLLRFEEIQKEALGYNPVAVAVVSVSGWHGDNMIKASTYMPWYKVTVVAQLISKLAVMLHIWHLLCKPIDGTYILYSTWIQVQYIWIEFKFNIFDLTSIWLEFKLNIFDLTDMWLEFKLNIFDLTDIWL